MSELGSLFKGYTQEAFRLELLPEYNVQGERENYKIFLETGEVIQDTDLVEYLQEVEQKIQAGAKHIRLRVLDSPINSYQIFETKVGYIPQHNLGVEIYFINRQDYEVLINKFPTISIKDFWLFDKKDLAFMLYNEDASWSGYQIISDKDTINIILQIRDVLLKNSYGIDEMLSLSGIK